LQVLIFHCPILANRPADFLSISTFSGIPFDSGFLLMLLLQATLTFHMVFQAPLSNLPNRFPHYFQPLRAFHFDFGFVRSNLQITVFHYPILANRPADFLDM
jgi:hypothetical protein